MLGLDASRVSVVPPGVDARFVPGGEQVPGPAGAGRRSAGAGEAPRAARRRRGPSPSASVPGSPRSSSSARATSAPGSRPRSRPSGGTSWIDLAGHVSDEDLADAYRRAWVLASTSLREGWNMTITEAGACGTPAVVSDIAGHRDALAHGVSGLLVDPGDEFVDALVQVLTDTALRDSLARGAVARSAQPHVGRHRGHGARRTGRGGRRRAADVSDGAAAQRRTATAPSSTTASAPRNTMAVHTSTLAASKCDGHAARREVLGGLRHDDVDDCRGGEAHHGQSPAARGPGARSEPRPPLRATPRKIAKNAACGHDEAGDEPAHRGHDRRQADGHRPAPGEGARPGWAVSRSSGHPRFDRRGVADMSAGGCQVDSACPRARRRRRGPQSQRHAGQGGQPRHDEGRCSRPFAASTAT